MYRTGFFANAQLKSAHCISLPSLAAEGIIFSSFIVGNQTTLLYDSPKFELLVLESKLSFFSVAI